jgi:thiamine biosynthesis lipoprotein
MGPRRAPAGPPVVRRRAGTGRERPKAGAGAAILAILAGLAGLAILAFGPPAPAAWANAEAGDSDLPSFAFTALSAEASLVLPRSGPAAPEELLVLVQKAVAEVERSISADGDGSDVVRFNRSPAGTWVDVGPMTLRALEECAAAHEYSGGAFDPTVGGLIGLFSADGGELAAWPDEEALERASETMGFGEIRIDYQGSRIYKPKEGMTLNLGAAAKGLAVDMALEALRGAGVKSALVRIGGEAGAIGPAPSGGPWVVMVDDPRNPGGRLTFELAGSSLATSGVKSSHFTFGGRRYLRTIDPRTKSPIEAGTLQAAVVHPSSCLAADVLSTALFVLGPPGARPALEAYVEDARRRGVGFAGLEASIHHHEPGGRFGILRYRVAEDGSVLEAEDEAAP